MSWIMFPDVVDIGELSLKQRNTGSFSGAMTFVRKASSAIAIFLIGVLLSLSGFVKPTLEIAKPIQPDSTLLTIRLIILMAFVLLMGTAWLIARRFALSPELSKRVKHLLERERDGILTAEENKEKEAVVKQLG